MYAQLFGYNGLAVLDSKTHEETAWIRLPEGYSGSKADGGAPSHGIGVSPHNKALWVNSSFAGGVFVYSLPYLKVQGFAKTGKVPFTPDGKPIYVANSGASSVSPIDTGARTEVARISSCYVLKRNGTVVVP